MLDNNSKVQNIRISTGTDTLILNHIGMCDPPIVFMTHVNQTRCTSLNVQNPLTGAQRSH